jgi:hypothetical protein
MRYKQAVVAVALALCAACGGKSGPPSVESAAKALEESKPLAQKECYPACDDWIRSSGEVEDPPYDPDDFPGFYSGTNGDVGDEFLRCQANPPKDWLGCKADYSDAEKRAFIQAVRRALVADYGESDAAACTAVQRLLLSAVGDERFHYMPSDCPIYAIH